MDAIESREQAAVAVNARVGSADSVGALDVQIGALARVDPLGALMVRLKYGQERRVSSFKQAVFLLARRERSSIRRNLASGGWKSNTLGGKRGRASPLLPDIIERFAKAVLTEWIDDRCDVCHGRGRVGASTVRVPSVETCRRCAGRGKVTIGFERRPFCAWPHGVARNEMLPNACWLPAGHEVNEFLAAPIREICPICHGAGRVQLAVTSRSARSCESCSGSGRKRFPTAQRAKVIGVSIVQYDALWHDRFEASLGMLHALDEWTDRRLAQQNGKRLDGTGG